MLTIKQVQHIARLARLALPEQEIKRYKTELSVILDYIKKLQEVDVSKIEPTSHPYLLCNVTRSDEIKPETVQRINKLLEAAPEKKGRYLKIKKVV